MRYATFDANGMPTGFYSDDVHGPRLLPVYGPIPEPTTDDPNPVAPIIGTKPNPACMIPAGAIEITDVQWQEFLANPGLRKWQNGQLVEYTPPPPVPTEADYGRAVQIMLDAKAQERSYDSIATAVSYRDDPNATYSAEGAALFNWRSAVWTYVYQQLAAVQAGTRAQPAVADFVTEVGTQCPFEWP